MQHSRKTSQVGAAALMLAVILGASFSSGTIAQTTSSPTTTASTLSPSVIKALQEALSKQGFTVETTGVFDDTTRNALRRFQTQHHLTVTGEADRATLTKLDRKSTRLNSSHLGISYAVFCLKKKKIV